MAETNKTPAPPTVSKQSGNAAPAAPTQPATKSPEAPAPPPAPAPAPAKKKRVSTVPADETNEQKIVRLSKARVNKAIKVIRQIGNLAAYKPSEEQAKKISDRLTLEVNTVVAKLTATKQADSDDFSL